VDTEGQMTNTILRSYAAMAIVIAGEKFTDRKEQEAVLDILNTCDTKHAWGTGTVRENLRQAWGWTVSDDQP
jgi:predicted TIM-barrel enzyme